MRKKENKEKSQSEIFPVLIERDEHGMYIGTVPSLRSCYTQGGTLSELYTNLEEVVVLSIEVEREFFKKVSKPNQIIGFQNIEFNLAV